MGANGKNHYDVVVIGSGMGGLTAAGLLAKEGRKVLVLEKEGRVGGFASSFEWKGRQFDKALHVIMGGSRPAANGDGIVSGVLDQLGVSDLCEFQRVDPFFRSTFPERDITVSGKGTEGYVESLSEHFPSHAGAVEELVATWEKIYRETLYIPLAPRLWQKLLFPIRFPNLVGTLGLTVDEGLDKRQFSPEAKAVLSTHWFYLGLPPSRASFPIWAVMMYAYAEEGAYFCLGGFQRMAEAFKTGVEIQGGEVRTSSPVRRIHVDQGEVRAVETEDGQTIRASVVISNIDARVTIRELVKGDHVPAGYGTNVARMEPSVHALALYTSVPRNLVPSGVAHENFVFASSDHDTIFQQGLEGRILGETVTIPSLTDPSVAPEGEHLILLKSVAPRAEGSIPEDAVQQMAECAKPLIPRLAEHLGTGHGAPAGNPDRYVLERLGPVYGWARTPDQVGPHALPNSTPIEGLYLCGHWSQPGAGIRTVVTSGIRVSRLVRGDRTSKGLVA